MLRGLVLRALLEVLVHVAAVACAVATARGAGDVLLLVCNGYVLVQGFLAVSRIWTLGTQQLLSFMDTPVLTQVL